MTVNIVGAILLILMSKYPASDLKLTSKQKIVRFRGLTLIELMVVIAIIGVLAGILIAVINPVRQRERAHDAGIVANTNKIVTAIGAHYAAKNRYPSCVELLETELSSLNLTAGDITGCDASTSPNEGYFNVEAINLPNTCGEFDPYSASGTETCNFRYMVSDDYSHACIGVKTNRGVDVNSDGVLNDYIFWSSVINMVDDDPYACCVGTNANWGTDRNIPQCIDAI